MFNELGRNKIAKCASPILKFRKFSSGRGEVRWKTGLKPD